MSAPRFVPKTLFVNGLQPKRRIFKYIGIWNARVLIVTNAFLVGDFESTKGYFSYEICRKIIWLIKNLERRLMDFLNCNIVPK